MSAQHCFDAGVRIGAGDVEGRFPHRDLAPAQDPQLDAETFHAGAGLLVLPLAFPDIGQHVARKRAQPLAQAIVLLARAAKNARNAARPRNCTLPKRTSQSSVKPSTSASMFHGMNRDSTCATNARASSAVRGLRPDSIGNA